MTKLLADEGYLLSTLALPSIVYEMVTERRWNDLDALIGQETIRGGMIFTELQKYAEFTSIEFIISIRSSILEEDEDGIWHDDGSRVLAFSLSLTLNPSEIEGGRLEIRRKDFGRELSGLGQKAGYGAPVELPTPAFGTLIVFATGHLGFEHKINRVVRGERIIIAGWCT